MTNTESMKLEASIDTLPSLSEYIREQKKLKDIYKEMRREKKSVYELAGYKFKSTI